jgi:adenine-specific DNA-methyltransferase
MARAPRPTLPTAIDSLKHKDRRVNIPTEELRDFVAGEENEPQTLLYPRDPSLDPQLVWKGKDDQDRAELAVPAVPIYIQEKIHPRAIIEAVRAEARREGPEQASLFADFNGIALEELIEFYQHDQNWSNRMILGDSLLVMTSLAEKEGLKGQVQCIYMDPPYGIKFGSNWQVSTRKRDVKDGRAEDATRQPEQIKAFRDTWELGIHSYLAYLRDRLVVARELLTESGSVFVQIGDENVHLVRCLMDEVFGSENFVAQIIVQKTGSQSGDYLPSINDYLCWYAKDRSVAKQKLRPLFLAREERDEEDYSPDPLTSAGKTPGSTFSYRFEDRDFHPGTDAHWKTHRDGMGRLRMADRIVAQKDQIRFKRFWGDFQVKPISNVWTGIGGASDIVYVVQTNTRIVERCVLMTTDPGDLVIDPTCGSGTTAYIAEKWGRRWITCDTSRVALALARTRLMAAKYSCYLLADSPEGVKKEAELSGTVPAEWRTDGDIRKGFVYKRVPHVTLKSIANNPAIDEISARWQGRLEPVRAELNRRLGQVWEEWEVPGEASGVWPADARELLPEWRRLRGERRAEIDAAIARHAETQTLYDQPYEDLRRIRVTGPFTVESLSPHRRLAAEEKRARSEGTSEAHPGVGARLLGPDRFGHTIIENLKKAGIQNTVKGERLKFDRLEPYAGEWLHAAGEYMEQGSNGDEPMTRRVAVCIGPEFGTVGGELVKEAAKEAVRGQGFDLLVVCGFAFEPGVYEEAKRYGRLTVLMSRMNPDLAMGDELLKKTGAGNLFMVFGEPDIRIEQQPDGRLVVSILGLDVYDPTTGEIRNNSTDDIACWFIDTDYNGESFFVRHAYFTGADRPYEKLKRALRAEIDEAAWASLYSTVSRPFERSKAGRVAVKVINHYGDEVVKVYEV